MAKHVGTMQLKIVFENGRDVELFDKCIDRVRDLEGSADIVDDMLRIRESLNVASAEHAAHGDSLAEQV